MSIKRKFAVSLFWAIAGNGANNIISFVIFSILARVVEPGQLGVVAFAMVFIELGRFVVQGGFAALLVQRPEWDEMTASTCFWTNIGVAAILAAIVSVVAGPVLDTYFSAGTGSVLTVLSACYLIDASRAIHEAWLRRHFKFRNLALRATVANLVAGVIGVSLAVSGFGIWALVAHRLSSSLMTSILTWVLAGWNPRFSWSLPVYKSIVLDGLRLVFAGLFEILNKRTSDLIIGSLLGPVAIATFRVGNRGFDALIQLAIIPLRSAALSAFSRVEGGAAGIGEAYLKASKFCALVATPIFLGSAVISDEFVTLVFGPRWATSAQVMAALSLAVLPSIIEYLLAPALTGAGKPDAVLRLHVAIFVGTIAACLFGVQFGLVAVAIAIAVRAHITLLYDLHLLKTVLHLSGRKILMTIFPAFMSGILMAAAGLVMARFFFASLRPEVSLICKIAVCMVIYPALLLLFWRRYTLSAVSEVSQMFPGIAARIRKFLPFKLQTDRQ